MPRAPERIAALCAGALALQLAACGPGARPVKAESTPQPTMPKPSPSAAVPRGPDLPTLDEVAARGPSVAPGMRELARQQSTVRRDLKVDAVRAEKHDTCGRVAFVATAPVIARLEDAGGNLLAETRVARKSGELGERGPVCVRRGDVLRASFATDSDAGLDVTIRWVAWGSE